MVIDKSIADILQLKKEGTWLEQTVKDDTIIMRVIRFSESAKSEGAKGRGQ